MKNISKIMSVILVFLLIMSLSTVTAFAADDREDKDLTGSRAITSASTEGIEDSDIEDAIYSVNRKMSKGHREDNQDNRHTIYVKYNGADMAVANFESKVFTFYDNVEKLSDSDRSKIVNEFIQALSKSEADDNLVQTFLSQLSEGDNALSSDLLSATFAYVQGDMLYAFKFMTPFLDVMNKILGVAAVILIIILLASTCLDLAYIGLPIFRENAAAKNEGNSNKRPFGVSFEAVKTVQDIEGKNDGEYKNAYFLYFKRRALSYILLAICIMYLITGGLGNIIGFVLRLVSGITG